MGTGVVTGNRNQLTKLILNREEEELLQPEVLFPFCKMLPAGKPEKTVTWYHIVSKREGGGCPMNSYLEKLHTNQIRFPNVHEKLLRNLFYLADRLKDEEELRMNIYNGFENYRDCVEDEGLKGITLSVKWEQDTNGHKEVAYRAVIKPKVLLAQLDRYCTE